MIYNVNCFINDLLDKYVEKKQQKEDIYPSIKSIKHADAPDLVIEPRPKIKISEPTIWKDNTICNSELQLLYEKEGTTKLKNKLVEAEMMKFKHVEPSILCKEIYHIYKTYIVKIHPSELIDYPDKACPGIEKIRSLNNRFINMYTQMATNNKKHVKYLIKLAEESKELKDYNNICTITTALRKVNLGNNDLTKINELVKHIDYFELRKRNEICLLPFELLLKDVEDSNANKGSELASKRFCDIIEFLVKVQVDNEDYKCKMRIQHFLLCQLFSVDECLVEEGEDQIDYQDDLSCIHLFL